MVGPQQKWRKREFRKCPLLDRVSGSGRNNGSYRLEQKNRSERFEGTCFKWHSEGIILQECGLHLTEGVSTDLNLGKNSGDIVD